MKVCLSRANDDDIQSKQSNSVGRPSFLFLEIESVNVSLGLKINFKVSETLHTTSN